MKHQASSPIPLLITFFIFCTISLSSGFFLGYQKAKIDIENKLLDAMNKGFLDQQRQKK